MIQTLKGLWNRVVFEYHYRLGIMSASDAQTQMRRDLAEKI